MKNRSRKIAELKRRVRAAERQMRKVMCEVGNRNAKVFSRIYGKYLRSGLAPEEKPGQWTTGRFAVC